MLLNVIRNRTDDVFEVSGRVVGATVVAIKQCGPDQKRQLLRRQHVIDQLSGDERLQGLRELVFVEDILQRGIAVFQQPAVAGELRHDLPQLPIAFRENRRSGREVAEDIDEPMCCISRIGEQLDHVAFQLVISVRDI